MSYSLRIMIFIVLYIVIGVVAAGATKGLAARRGLPPNSDDWKVVLLIVVLWGAGMVVLPFLLLYKLVFLVTRLAPSLHSIGRLVLFAGTRRAAPKN